MQLELNQKNKAADLCKQCMGWCCYRFVVRMPFKNGKIDWEGLRELHKDDAELQREVDFMQHNFIKKRSRVSDGYSRATVFTCKQYDTEKHTCKVYDGYRPKMCYRFVCDHAYHDGRVPDRRDYKSTARSMRRAGIKITCADGRKTPRRRSMPSCHDDEVCPKDHEDLLTCDEVPCLPEDVAEESTQCRTPKKI